ncbi:MAG: hypothetical protein M3Y53_06815, partial [Thermoproteota archaeon]|nr:hypothetical protein [Thermoproteota archaeon]
YILRRVCIRILQFVSKVTVMKDRVYIEVPKEHRVEIRELHGEPLIVDVNRILSDREVKQKDVTVSDREAKTFAKDLHTQLQKDKKRKK